mmetsp:Transcript_65158/g.121461  ORF Transcript_65158/g.121461 Transcript_65158/m.121461 type:complete len:214 (+) Transcript_65158:397-1038(+)
MGSSKAAAGGAARDLAGDTSTAARLGPASGLAVRASKSCKPYRMLPSVRALPSRSALPFATDLYAPKASGRKRWLLFIDSSSDLADSRAACSESSSLCILTRCWCSSWSSFCSRASIVCSHSSAAILASVYKSSAACFPFFSIANSCRTNLTSSDRSCVRVASRALAWSSFACALASTSSNRCCKEISAARLWASSACSFCSMLASNAAGRDT